MDHEKSGNMTEKKHEVKFAKKRRIKYAKKCEMKFTKKCAGGSFTVEAALVIPAVLGVIVLFIYITLFFYDRCAIAYVSTKVCERAVYDINTMENAKAIAEDELSGKLAGRWDHDISVSGDEKSVYITVRSVTPLFNMTFSNTAKADKYFCPKY